MKTLFLIHSIFIFSIHEIIAQTPFLVKDFNQERLFADNEPTKLEDMGDYACFFADDGIHGFELWITDGTDYGTRLLKDIFPGSMGSGNYLPYFCRLGNQLFFAVKMGPGGGPELWRTDGTTEGTVMVSAGPFNYIPEELTALNNRIVFKVYAPATQYSLWVSDGTETGTHPIKQFSSPNTHDFEFAPSGNGLLFASGSAENGVELWKTDGTEAGTQMLKDIYTGTTGSYPTELTSYRDKVFFTCHHPDYGNEIWVSDGTANGTTLLKDIKAGTQDSWVSSLGVVMDTMYFTAQNANSQNVLWQTDGTTDQTKIVQPTAPGVLLPNVSNILPNDSFVLVSVIKNNGWELWRKNGHNGLYNKIKDNAKPGANNASSFEEWISIQNRSFFSYRAYPNPDPQFWVSDGTTNGTYLLLDYQDSNEMKFRGITNLSSFDNDVYFNNASYSELWKSNSTPRGIKLVKEIKDINGSTSFNDLFQTLENDLYFSISGIQNSNPAFWKSNGTKDGTIQITTLEENNSIGGAKMLDGDIYFSKFRVNQNTGSFEWELHKMDTAGNNKIKLKDGLSDISADFFEFRNKLYFSASTVETGMEPWVTDGTPEGTKLLLDVNAGSSGSIPGIFCSAGETLFFKANYGLTGEELWALGPTDAVPHLLKDGNPANNYSAPLIMGPKDGQLLFFANRSSSALTSELWKTNGTPAGTVKIKSFGFNPFMYPKGFYFNEKYYFTANDGINGYELWTSDGTDTGTKLFKDINANPGEESNPSEFCDMGSYFIFRAYTSGEGDEPWRSDGTAEGTRLIKDIYPGTMGSSTYLQFFAFKDKAYFSAANNENGEAMWITDGTEGGTIVLKDLNETSEGIYARNFVAAQNTLFFAATTFHNKKGYGEELWSLKPCIDTLSALPVESYVSFHQEQLNDTLSCRCNIYGELMEKVISNGDKPITGEILSKVWIQENAPTGYVNKVYEILPENKDSLATGTVTLYYSQEDFDAFNQIHNKKLPSNPLDSVGIKKLHVELRKGESKNGSGLPVSFTKQIETIQPNIDQILWDSAKNRWEIEVAITGGFGGFFVKADSCMLSESFTWRGNNSEDWENENNWLEKTKPSTGANIIIPSFRRYYPLISDNISIRKLQLEKGATLKINPGVVIEINEKICR